MYPSNYHLVNNTSHKNYRFQGSSPFFEIIREISDETGFKTKDVGFIIYFFFEKLATRLAYDGELYVNKFGKFVVSDRKITHLNGEEMIVRVVRFVASKPLKKFINSVKESDRTDEKHS